MAGFQFNSNEHNPSQSFDPLPAGWYVAQVVNSEIKPTAKPGGARLNLQFKILNAPAAGRVVFGGYNIKNDNPIAVEIAMNELAALSNAIATPVWTDSEQLHGKPFHLKLKIVKDATGQYEDKNEPSGYKGINEVVKLVEQLATGPAAVPQTMGQMGQGFPGGGTGNPNLSPSANPNVGASAAGAPGNAGQQPQGWGNQQAQQSQPAVTQQRPNWGNQSPQQQQQTQQVQQQAPVQQNEQQAQQAAVQQQTQQTQENYQQAASSQPWNAGVEQQVQQQVQQQTQRVQQVQQSVQVDQQAVQQQQDWAQQQVTAGQQTQQVQQNVQAQQVQEQPQDEIAQQAQADVPPWKRQPQ